MFAVSTKREETAYRLGYHQAWTYMLAVITILSPLPVETYRALRIYATDTLWPWFEEEPPRIGELAPGFKGES